jgi:hypothetical protein
VGQLRWCRNLKEWLRPEEIEVIQHGTNTTVEVCSVQRIVESIEQLGLR